MMNDTVCADNPLKATFMVYIPFIVLPLHISNITTILVHHKFHQNVYFLLLNLSVSDAMCILFVLLIPAGVSPTIYMAIFRAFLASSILFTCTITLDRYIKVKYPLRYLSIATRPRLIMLVFFVWCFTVCVSLLSKIPFLFEHASVYLLTVIDIVAHRVFDIVAVILLIAASIYVLCVRKKHMEEIQKRRRYFGVHGEEFNILKSMAVSIREMIKLNIVTALLVITGAVCRLLNLFCVHGVHKLWFKVPVLLFYLSNPFFYICVMKELRNHYLRLLKCKRRRQTRPELTTTKF